MKKFPTIAAAALCSISLAAQEPQEVITSEEIVVTPGYGYDMKSNWFISAGAGPQIMFGDHDKQRSFGQRISPALDVSVGKWISPSIGLRLTYSGLYAKGATQNGIFSTGERLDNRPWDGYWLEKSKYNFMNLHVDVMFDLCNIIGGYNPSRIYSCTFYGGVGYATTWDKPHNQTVTASVGVLNSFHVSKAFDINADIRGTGFGDNFDGAEGSSRFDGLLSVTVGLTYKFAPRGWKNARETVTVTKYDNDAINELRRQLNELIAKNEKLERDAKGKGVVHTVVKAVGGDYLIYFPINVSELSKADRAQLDMCANTIKNAPENVKFTIIGYADKYTGTPEINELLSRKRAESVKQCLVEEFDIDPSRLEETWKGGVDNMFYNDPALSRAVIITPQD